MPFANAEARKDYHRQYNREYRKAHLESIRKSAREYYHRNKEKLAAYNREYRKKNPDQHRDTMLRCDYGIGSDVLESLLFKQDYRCPICGKTLRQSDKPRPHLDHNHSTMEVRGVLCVSCNTGIGSLKEDPIIFHKAAEYLESAHTGIFVHGRLTRDKELKKRC